MRIDDLSLAEGKHILTGILLDLPDTHDDFSNLTDGICLEIDNKQYQFYRNDSDGYRSYMDILEKDIYKVTKLDQPIRIEIKTKYEDWHHDDEDYVYVIYNDNTNEIIAVLGVANIDDYYPSCVLKFDITKLDVNNK